MPEIRTSDSVTIHYETNGDTAAPPVIFSNSLGTNLAMWEGQASEALQLGFRAIRYDQRGHGRSGAPAGPYSIERLAQDVLELMDALALEKASFCGLSMGAMTGIWLAREHPRRTARLAACNAAAWFQDKSIWDGRIRTVAEKGVAAVADQVVERWFTKDFRARSPQEVDRIRSMILATDPQGYNGCVAAIRDMDIRDRLGLIECPVLVVVGSHDPVTTPDHGRYLFERIPGAQRAELETAHLSNVEDPEHFNSAVFGFFSGKRL